ncbi:unnamed protein product [Rotaria socialis]|uniref:Sulfotransferase n=2 Tax=Rotaria TaxID=231623 RepID=A0A816X299_9BILA|nr:unnamed protein product [Rotaria magnacalcarata]CAF3373334.1 unnamed protein product [Rotaria socialis]CAF1681500.1 unnamed protein product [Rotaria magnacalcarata]CAF2034014.1 unnamed protein product [Rotaria magnacalcarata]CAF2067028.1 unnamed protein product [Rotaria magnacalcarata]
MSLTNQTEPETWFYDETNEDYDYGYHKTFLSMLNSVDAPRSRWLLKSSDHALFLDTFFHHYPNAKMIMPHRHLDDVLPSVCHTVWAFNNMFFDEKKSTARNTLNIRTLRYMDTSIGSIVKFRTCHHRSHRNIFDVIYDDLIE